MALQSLRPLCKTQHSFFASLQGNRYIRNFMVKNDTMFINSRSRVFLIGHVAVTKKLEEEGKRQVNPPKTPFITLDKGLSSPTKSCIYIKGQVAQVDSEREVNFRGSPTTIKEIWLADNTTPKAKVTLWREQCLNKLHPGDFVEFTDVVTTTYKNEASFSLTSRSTIQEAFQLACVRSVVILGNLFEPVPA